ncbi:MAG TPA: hypothetical protein VF017_05165 [Thermoanaerobaculia bacterium]|nr:hypothetical protein [Thermoanaerobaculia bacterium]
MAEAKKTNPWVWVAAGCGGVIVLGGLAIMGLGWWGFNKAKSFERQLKDPVAREASVREILGADSLPDGYHAHMGMSLLGFMKMAMLSDRELPAGEDPGGKVPFDERGFFYFDMMAGSKNAKKVEDFIAGRIGVEEMLEDTNVNLDLDEGEKIAEGPVAIAGGQARYVAQRGGVGMGVKRQDDSLNTMVLVDCPGDRRFRFAIWFGPDPNPDAPADQLDLTGTPADPAALEAFLGHFHLCGR